MIGEGIETAYQEEQLKVLGCEQGQGYYQKITGLKPRHLWRSVLRLRKLA